ncbi:MAG: hypothetical protein UT03_C0062G0005 [Candidatus Moranbacteria bacterium GW2011_GWD2_38_7]|nr:MAG: hypothetical protein UT03_C0062G0005 [Candidatus Moranbacteria bacterium GW2011_GWD2_38_7]
MLKIRPFNAVCSRYSAVYFTIPLLIPPPASVLNAVIKLRYCPITARPAGPIWTATILFIRRPAIILIAVERAVNRDVPRNVMVNQKRNERCSSNELLHPLREIVVSPTVTSVYQDLIFRRCLSRLSRPPALPHFADEGPWACSIRTLPGIQPAAKSAPDHCTLPTGEAGSGSE